MPWTWLTATRSADYIDIELGLPTEPLQVDGSGYLFVRAEVYMSLGYDYVGLPQCGRELSERLWRQATSTAYASRSGTTYKADRRCSSL